MQGSGPILAVNGKLLLNPGPGGLNQYKIRLTGRSRPYIEVQNIVLNFRDVLETDLPEPEWRVYHWVSFTWCCCQDKPVVICRRAIKGLV
jgi:hypothetical protein